MKRFEDYMKDYVSETAYGNEWAAEMFAAFHKAFDDLAFEIEKLQGKEYCGSCHKLEEGIVLDGHDHRKPKEELSCEHDCINCSVDGCEACGCEPKEEYSQEKHDYGQAVKHATNFKEEPKCENKYYCEDCDKRYKVSHTCST